MKYLILAILSIITFKSCDHISIGRDEYSIKRNNYRKDISEYSDSLQYYINQLIPDDYIKSLRSNFITSSGYLSIGSGGFDALFQLDSSEFNEKEMFYTKNAILIDSSFFEKSNKSINEGYFVIETKNIKDLRIPNIFSNYNTIDTIFNANACFYPIVIKHGIGNIFSENYELSNDLKDNSFYSMGVFVSKHQRKYIIFWLYIWRD